MRFWLLFILLAPLLLAQARRARRNTPRLPEAGGPDHGVAGDGEPALRLLVAGESTAVGVGVAHHEQGLGGALARALARRHGQAVGWRVLGMNGSRALGLLPLIIKDANKDAPDADAVVLSLGVNDTTGFTAPRRYGQHLEALILALRRHRPERPVYLLAVPPIQQFTALPRPLRDVLGLRAAALDRAQQRLAARLPGVHHLTYPAISDPACLAEDGYHPSADGYAYIAERVATSITLPS